MTTITSKEVFKEIGIHQVGLLPGAKYDNFNDIERNWEFNFIINGNKIKDKIKTYDINKNIKIEDEGFKAEFRYKNVDNITCIYKVNL